MLPMWSDGIDSGVLRARAFAPARLAARAFDIRQFPARLLTGHGAQYVLLARAGPPVRIDVVEGSLLEGPVCLIFEVRHDARLLAQLSALRSFHGITTGGAATAKFHARYAENMRALFAVDLREAGRSLREAADALLGPGDWPGEGEWRKSRIRRLIGVGEALIHAGPRAILG
jgi:hypothetical protein